MTDPTTTRCACGRGYANHEWKGGRCREGGDRQPNLCGCYEFTNAPPPTSPASERLSDEEIEQEFERLCDGMRLSDWTIPLAAEARRARASEKRLREAIENAKRVILDYLNDAISPSCEGPFRRAISAINNALAAGDARRALSAPTPEKGEVK
jgi:hypothetical protein